MSDVIDSARWIADEVFFPAAAKVDADGAVPGSHFDVLAEHGFYGLVAPAEQGGVGADLSTATAVMETLASGCMTTTFTWAQHHGAVIALQGTTNADLRTHYLKPLVSGDLRAGVGFAGAIPQPPKLWARRTADGFVLDGEAPFVTGWGVIDLLQLSARETGTVGTGEAGQVTGGTVVTGLVAAAPAEGLSIDSLPLVALQGSNTVRLRFDGYVLPRDRVVAEITHDKFLESQVVGSRVNGCLPLGLAARCIRLLQEREAAELAAALADQLAQRRTRLDEALSEPATLPAARAASAELALRAANALVVTVGSSAVLAGNHAERLSREAAFTAVAASRPEIKQNLQHLLGLTQCVVDWLG